MPIETKDLSELSSRFTHEPVVQKSFCPFWESEGYMGKSCLTTCKGMYEERLSPGEIFYLIYCQWSLVEEFCFTIKYPWDLLSTMEVN